MTDWNWNCGSVGNGLMVAFTFFLIAMAMLFSVAMDNYSWYQPIILQIVNFTGLGWFVGLMIFIGFVIGYRFIKDSPPL